MMAQIFEYTCLYSQTLSSFEGNTEEGATVTNISISVIQLN